MSEVVLSVATRLRQGQDFEPLIAETRWSSENFSASSGQVRGIETVAIRMRAPLIDGRLLSVAGFLSTLYPDIQFLRLLFRQRNVQVVNAHFPDLNAWVPLLMKTAGLYAGVVALSFHGSDLTTAQSTSGLERRLWRQLVSQADVRTACSHSLAGDITRFADAPVQAIHNGAELEIFRRDWRRQRPRRSILHIGKYEYRKSHDLLLQAFLGLRKTIPDARLTIVGASGPMLRATREMVASLGLTDAVELHVDLPHERLPEFTDRADVFVLPSRAEPFGIALVEAGAAGLPVVASNVGGIPELIDHDRTGLLVTPNDVEAVRQSLERLMTCEPLADRLAESWQREAISRFRWETTAENYVSVMRNAASCRASA